MSNKPGFPWKTVLIIVAVFTVLCCGLAAIGGGIVYFLSQSEEGLPDNVQFDFNLGGEQEIPSGQPSIAPPTSVIASPVAASTGQPEADQSTVEEPELAEPVVEEPSESNAALTGKQEKTDLRIFDDFSSNSFEWYEKEEPSYAIKFENEAYKFHSKEKEYFVWAEFPVDFIPYEIAFDVKGPTGEQDGTFGVECHYLDDDNTYFIEFDLSTNKYTITETKDGKDIPLTKSSYGQTWLKASALKSPPTSVNRIKISCYLESISLYINDKFVDQVDVMDPLPEPGIGTFYVNTFDDSDKDGYFVIFDNVEIYEPMQ